MGGEEEDLGMTDSAERRREDAPTERRSERVTSCTRISIVFLCWCFQGNFKALWPNFGHNHDRSNNSKMLTGKMLLAAHTVLLDLYPNTRPRSSIKVNLPQTD